MGPFFPPPPYLIQTPLGVVRQIHPVAPRGGWVFFFLCHPSYLAPFFCWFFPKPSCVEDSAGAWPFRCPLPDVFFFFFKIDVSIPPRNLFHALGIVLALSPPLRVFSTVDVPSDFTLHLLRKKNCSGPSGRSLCRWASSFWLAGQEATPFLFFFLKTEVDFS